MKNKKTDHSIIEELNKQITYLNRQQYIFNEMLNKLEDGIYITDEKGVTLYVNDSFVNLSGIKRSEIIGKTVYELKENKILPNSCCAKVIETKKPYSTINNYYKGQKCLVSGSPIYDIEGNLTRVIGVIRDVSELDMLMKKITKEQTLAINYTKILESSENNINSEDLAVSNDDLVKSIFKKAKRIANVDSTILILGETGVGKDFLASYIHSMSYKNKETKLIKINCAAIPEHLIESELFGYEEGAFTGAQKGGKKGLFEEANNGTLFLDEIGDMPYTLQVKLLNAINDRAFYRIGGNHLVKFNARIIAATNANLEKLVNEKKFREDLFYRLNVVNFKIPSLRDRKEDILPLAQKFLEFYNNKYRRNCFFSPKCLEAFLTYKWPGNIREMKNIIERLVLISEDIFIDINLFEEQVLPFDKSIKLSKKINLDKNQSLKERLEDYEKSIIQTTIDTSETLKEVAEKLNVDISTIVRKKQKYKL